MRVLWLTNQTFENRNKSSVYNGGGWIDSLKCALLNFSIVPHDLSIGIVAFGDLDYHELDSDGINHYCIERIKAYLFNYKHKENIFLEKLLSVVNDFSPDVIHVFGSEKEWGLISTLTDIPIVLHIQGILTPYYEAWLPQNMTWSRFIFQNKKQWIIRHNLRKFVAREQRIFRNTHSYMGRTDWDFYIAKLMSPECNYYYCSEMLRPVIYNSSKIWQYHERENKRIISIISNSPYKGSDIVLRTAKILKLYMKNKFEWHVYGINDISFGERVTGIKANEVNVFIHGIISADNLVEVIANGDIYCHPSYIENSPNTVCEAQLLGIPVVTTNGGGTSSLINNSEDGVLVNTNDVYYTASVIKDLLTDKEKSVRIGKNGRQTALKRHNPETIVNDLVKIYKRVSKKCF